MALIVCPECGRKVSDRANVCPECGFPIQEYVVELREAEIATDGIKNEGFKAKKSESHINKRIVKTFTILGYKWEIAEEEEVYNSIRKEFVKLADNARYEAMRGYSSAENIRKVLEEVPTIALKYHGYAFDKCMEMLYRVKVNMSIEEFAEKYHQRFSYDKYIEPILEKYTEIIDEKTMLKEYRTLQQSNRSRWQGGGFGVGGAVKGAIIAGALNTGTDFLRSFGDLDRKFRDNTYIQNKLTELYRSEKVRNRIIEGTYSCILDVFDAFYERKAR